jgi:hypothetical protein
VGAGWSEPRQRLYTSRDRARHDVLATGKVDGVRRDLLAVEGDMHLGRYGVFGEQTLSTSMSPRHVELWISPDPHDGN